MYASFAAPICSMYFRFMDAIAPMLFTFYFTCSMFIVGISVHVGIVSFRYTCWKSQPGDRRPIWPAVTLLSYRFLLNLWSCALKCYMLPPAEEPELRAALLFLILLLNLLLNPVPITLPWSTLATLIIH